MPPKTKTKKREFTRLQKRIISMRKRGWTYFEIEEETGSSMSWIWKTLKLAGLVESRKRRRRRR